MLPSCPETSLSLHHDQVRARHGHSTRPEEGRRGVTFELHFEDARWFHLSLRYRRPAIVQASLTLNDHRRAFSLPTPVRSPSHQWQEGGWTDPVQHDSCALPGFRAIRRTPGDRGRSLSPSVGPILSRFFRTEMPIPQKFLYLRMSGRPNDDRGARSGEESRWSDAKRNGNGHQQTGRSSATKATKRSQRRLGGG